MYGSAILETPIGRHMEPGQVKGSLSECSGRGSDGGRARPRFNVNFSAIRLIVAKIDCSAEPLKHHPRYPSRIRGVLIGRSWPLSSVAPSPTWSAYDHAATPSLTPALLRRGWCRADGSGSSFHTTFHSESQTPDFAYLVWKEYRPDIPAFGEVQRIQETGLLAGLVNAGGRCSHTARSIDPAPMWKPLPARYTGGVVLSGKTQRWVVFAPLIDLSIDGNLTTDQRSPESLH